MQFLSKILVGLLTGLCIASGAYAQTVTDTLKRIGRTKALLPVAREKCIETQYRSHKSCLYPYLHGLGLKSNSS